MYPYHADLVLEIMIHNAPTLLHPLWVMNVQGTVLRVVRGMQNEDKGIFLANKVESRDEGITRYMAAKTQRACDPLSLL